MDFDLFKPKAPPLFGLDISSSSVKMLEIVEAGRGAYRVEHYAIEPLIRDTVVDGNISNLEQAADAVKRAHKRLGTRTRHVAMAVPTGAVITKKIVVAAGLREDELEVQVESEANQYIPFALEEVNLDFQSLGPTASNPDEQEVLIAATRKEKVEDRVAVAHLAGLKPLVMDVESFAQQAALSLVVQALPGGGQDQNIAVVDVGANIMNVTVLRNDQSVYTREQAFGGNQLTQEIVSRYGMSAEEAETAKRSGGLPHFFGLSGGTALAGIVIVVVMHGFYATKIEIQADRNKFLKSEVAKLDKEIAEINKLKDEIQALLARKQVIETLQADRAQTVHLLDQLVRQVPEGVYLRSIVQRGLRVKLLGYEQSNASVSTVMGNMQASP